MKTKDLVLERRLIKDGTVQIQAGNSSVLMTPPVGEDYWALRVKVSEKQAVIGFPKFFTIGIGFAVEKADWNTNLPYTCDTLEIYNHIKANKGPGIDKELCLEAIRMIQQSAPEFLE